MAKGWLSKITGGSITGVVSYLTTNYIIPVGVPVVTGVVGLVQGFPWFYIIIGVSFVTATVFSALVKWDEWRIRTKVENKIGFRTVQFANDVHGNGITVGFAIDNLANFPIDFEVYEMMVKLGDKVPQEDHKAGQILTMPSKGVGWHYSHAINLDNPPINGTIDGYLSYKIRYGRLKDLRHMLSEKKNITVIFDDKGEPSGGTFSNSRDEAY
jgi:hypothetical protein